MPPLTRSRKKGALNRNLENLQSHLLEDLDFHFDVKGVTETKITNSNSEGFISSIPGYNFEYVPTPLSAGGVMFIDAALDYVILEKNVYYGLPSPLDRNKSHE